MTEYLFQLSESYRGTLQTQIQEMLVNTILDGQLDQSIPLPSSRKLAKQLHVARNTVVYAYQHLVDEGFLISRERSGFYINPDIFKGRVPEPESQSQLKQTGTVNWHNKLKLNPSQFRQNRKPANWNQFPYPFICGQYDRELFPISDWRECSRDATTVGAIHNWAKDQIDQDNPELIEQIHKRILPRRGVWVEQEEILVTLGAQQGLFLAAQLLVDKTLTIGVESPGYVDAHHTFATFSNNIIALDVDHEGLIPNEKFQQCDVVYTTPSHHYPTTVTMPKSRRLDLLTQAHHHDILLIEDDYESEFNYIGDPTPALKSLDQDGRVIYIGSLSKTLAPGIRLGYMVGPTAVIKQARALRRLMHRHPPSNNQHIISQFLKRGYHDALIHRMSHTLHERWQILGEILEQRFPGTTKKSTFGGSAFWVEGPENLDAKALFEKASQAGIIFEPGEVFFHTANPPKNFFRLGFSSIRTDKIHAGIQELIALIDQ